MFNKFILASSILALSSSVAFAAGPYVGAGLGVNTGTFDISDNVNNFKSTAGGRGAIGNLFAGYGAIVSSNLYLGGEVFANLTNTESQESSGPNKYTVKNKYGYGISFIPGVMLSDHTMLYGRLGVVRSRFESKATTAAASSTATKTLTGGQVGVGIQTSLTQNLDLRGEYDYTSYGSTKFNNAPTATMKIQPRADIFTVGLVYKFD